MKVNIVNLTGETQVILRKPPENIIGSTGDAMILEPDPHLPKVVVRNGLKREATLRGIPIFYEHETEIEYLPEPAANTVYLVPPIAARAALRSDVLCPGPDVFDNDGRYIGCAGLISVVPIDQFYSQSIKNGTVH